MASKHGYFKIESIDHNDYNNKHINCINLLNY